MWPPWRDKRIPHKPTTMPDTTQTHDHAKRTAETQTPDANPAAEWDRTARTRNKPNTSTPCPKRPASDRTPAVSICCGDCGKAERHGTPYPYLSRLLQSGLPEHLDVHPRDGEDGGAAKRGRGHGAGALGNDALALSARGNHLPKAKGDTVENETYVMETRKPRE